MVFSVHSVVGLNVPTVMVWAEAKSVRQLKRILARKLVILVFIKRVGNAQIFEYLNLTDYIRI